MTLEQASRDPRIPPLDRCIPGRILDRHARERPEKVFVEFQDGTRWTYGEFHKRVRATAAGLQRLGVGQGGHVVVWLPNGPSALTVWFAINYIGAVYVPFNIAWRGRVLEHALQIADAALVVAHQGLVERFDGLEWRLPAARVIVGGAGREGWIGEAALFEAPGEPAPPSRDIMPWDLHSILYTSGTTGLSKGVLQPYLQQYAIATGGSFLSEDDRYLMTLPLYHQGGVTGVYRMFFRGGTVIMVDAFDTSSFWSTVRATSATSATLLGAMAKFLAKQAPSDQDRAHTLRSVIMSPLEDHHQFARRFGVDVYSVYNMTELGAPLETLANPVETGTCGRARPGFELRLVDQNDCEVPVGQAGELVVRTDMPWALSTGYAKDPAATANAWRNGWFHTGDLFTRDAAGNYYFCDRLKDAIRRRGENVSAFEVESEILAHPCVQEAAVVAVPSDHSEDEILAVLAPVPGREIDPRDVLEFLRPRLAHFMIPRYIRILPSLPKTESQKVQKQVLRDQGLVPGTWDREAAGIRIRRERLV